MSTPEQRAREEIDRLLQAAGWVVQDFKAADIHAAHGVAIREFELNAGCGTADYLLYVDGKAAGVIEAKKQGATLTGVEMQSGGYAQGLPATLPAWRRPQPIVYESTGVETHLTNGLDPAPRARSVFAFHRPETLADWLQVLDKPTRARRDWQLDYDFEYAPEELDRSVQSLYQIRTIARTLRDRWQTDLFPQRQELPKTLVFAKAEAEFREHPVNARVDDRHAERSTSIVRDGLRKIDEFGQRAKCP